MGYLKRCTLVKSDCTKTKMKFETGYETDWKKTKTNTTKNEGRSFSEMGNLFTNIKKYKLNRSLWSQQMKDEKAMQKSIGMKMEKNQQCSNVNFLNSLFSKRKLLLEGYIFQHPGCICWTAC